MNYNYRYSKSYGYNDNYRGPEPKTRGSGLQGFLRNSNRLSKQLERQNRARQRELERIQRQAERDHLALEKEKVRLMQEEVILDIEEKNDEIVQHIEMLQGILEQTLSVNDMISFDSLKVKEEYPSFSPPVNLLKKKYPPNKTNFTVKPLNWITKILPGAEERYNNKLKDAEEQYRQAVRQFEKEETERQNELKKIKRDYEEKRAAFLAEAQRHNREVDTMRELYSKGDHDGIIYYNGLVLERSEYPDEFPQGFDLSYDIEEKALRIEYKLPPLSIIPPLKELKYLKKSNELKEIQRKDTEINKLYKDVIVAVALRSLHEIFEADQGSHVNFIEFEGDSQLLDKATGHHTRILVSAGKEEFNKLNLALIDKMTCFKKLGGKFTSD